MAATFRPPINRAMKSLDRSFFNLSLPISAARVLQNQYISNCRSQLTRSKDLLEAERLDPIDRDPDPSLAKAGRKCLLLRSDLKHNGREVDHGLDSTWFMTIDRFYYVE
jgi:tRNA (guanine37-N1)-methyltransferase